MTYRNADTRMWKDDWFLDLEPLEKLLFIYLFTNDNTTLTGLYKISMRVIEFETALDKEFILSTLDKFSHAGKVHYHDNLIWVVNLRKYNDSKSPKVQSRINYELTLIPDCPLKKAYISGNIQYLYSMDTDSTIQINPNQSINNTIQLEEEEATSQIYRTYEAEFGPITPAISDKLEAARKDYQASWIVEAIKIGSVNNARSLSYVFAILKGWKEHGYGWKPGSNGKGGKQDKPASHDAIEIYLKNLEDKPNGN